MLAVALDLSKIRLDHNEFWPTRGEVAGVNRQETGDQGAGQRQLSGSSREPEKGTEVVRPRVFQPHRGTGHREDGERQHADPRVAHPQPAKLCVNLQPALGGEPAQHMFGTTGIITRKAVQLAQRS